MNYKHPPSKLPLPHGQYADLQTIYRYLYFAHTYIFIKKTYDFAIFLFSPIIRAIIIQSYKRRSLWFM